MKRQKRYKGIAKKAIVKTLLLLAAMIALVYIAIYFILTQKMEESQLSELYNDAEMIARLESRFVDSSKLSERISIYESLTGATVIIINETKADSEGMLYVFVNDDNADTEVNKARRRIAGAIDKYIFERVLSGEKIKEYAKFEFSSADLLVAGIPITDETGDISEGIVIARTFEPNILNRFDMLGVVALAFALGAVPALAVYLFWLLRSLYAPLRTINEGTTALLEGNYGDAIKLDRYDEFGEIALTLNVLSRRLKNTFEGLENERDELRQIINNMADGIIAVDWYMYVTNHNMTSLEMLEWSAMPDKLDDASELALLLRGVMRTREAKETILTPSSGRRISAVATPIVNKSGIVSGAVCLLADVSERERLEQLRRDYTANISHELRTPLTGIRGMVEPLMDGVFETREEQMDSYNVIYNETLRLEKLIDDMLDISRLQSGKEMIEVEPLIINGILISALKRVEGIAKEQQVTLKNEISAEDLACIGNEDRIIELATIFLDNALSFTPAGGSVTLFAKKDGENVLFGVSDTGRGIEPKDLPYIFERFYKADKARTRGGGTGLGLAIAKLIVDGMHGTLTVKSEPGSGSVFTVALPAIDGKEQEQL